MKDTQHGKIVFECDSCDEVLETGTGIFDDAVAHLKREGWHAKRIGDVWLHGCPRHKP